VTKLHSCGSAFLVLARCVVASCLAVGGLAHGQVSYAEQEVRVSDLPALTAKTTNASDVLATSVEIIFHDKDVCCGKNSALDYNIRAADPMTLKDVSDKLRGRHVVSDGRAFMVTAEYLPAAAVNVGWLIGSLKEKQALLMEWNAHLYVVYGVTYVETYVETEDSTGGIVDAVHKFLLLDPRFSDERRMVSFNRLTDDFGKVQGLLRLKAVVQ
jgi:hypothetical protein